LKPIFNRIRQNIAEIDEIPWTEKIEKVVLPAAERAIYLELEHHLRALDMTIKRVKKTESDREKRLAASLGDSKFVIALFNYFHKLTQPPLLQVS
jgi:hypothetical protein